MMYSAVETITPDLAREMLARNMENNRRINHSTVKRYARIMKSGGWNLTHQGIAFDEAGKLIDGQHRLEGIVMANEPIKMMVTRGVQRMAGEAFTIDVGTKRTTQNIMQISGINDDVYKKLAPYVASYMRLKGPYPTQPEAAEVIAYTDRHYDELSALYDILRRSKEGGGRAGIRMHTIMGTAMIGAYYHGEPKAALKAFVDVYCHNDVKNVADYNARYALDIREYVRSHRPTPETLRRCECAIYSFAHNQSIMRICERYPFRPALDA